MNDIQTGTWAQFRTAEGWRCTLDLVVCTSPQITTDCNVSKWAWWAPKLLSSIAATNSCPAKPPTSNFSLLLLVEFTSLQILCGFWNPRDQPWQLGIGSSNITSLAWHVFHPMVLKDAEHGTLKAVASFAHRVLSAATDKEIQALAKNVVSWCLKKLCEFHLWITNDSLSLWSHHGLVLKPKQTSRQWSGTAVKSSCHSWMDCRMS